MSSERRKYMLRERICLVKQYTRYYGNYQDVIIKFSFNLPDSIIPSHTSLWRMMKCFEETGCVVGNREMDHVKHQ